jgi:hypothetical protein
LPIEDELKDQSLEDALDQMQYKEETDKLNLSEYYHVCAKEFMSVQQQIELFVNSYPELNIFIDIIKAPERNKIAKDLINAIYVLAGIKPVLVIESSRSKEIKDLIIEFVIAFPHLKQVAPVDNYGNFYLINEKPIAEFDPRRFINEFSEEYQNLADAVTYAFPSQDSPKTDKLLSYLLGFGPTWESYAGIGKRMYLKKNTSLSVFSEEHYFQLGEAIYKNKNIDTANLTKKQYVEKGKKYSLNVQNKEWPNCLTAIMQPSPIEKEIKKLYMEQVIDETSYQTSYIQKGIEYRKVLLNNLNISGISSNILKFQGS